MSQVRSPLREKGIRRLLLLRRLLAKGRHYMSRDALKIIRREKQHQIRLNKTMRERGL